MIDKNHNIKIALKAGHLNLLSFKLFMCLFATLFFCSTGTANAQLYSGASVHITGAEPKSTASIEIENSGTLHQQQSDKSGEVFISGQFAENPQIGVSSGVNYTLNFSVPYEDLDGREKSIQNTITLSFSALTGDVIFLGRTSDTALIEYTSGAREMQNITASTSGLFRGGSIKNEKFNKNKSGSVFLIITNTNPETGDPLDPVYVEAGFSIASLPSNRRDKKGVQAIYQSISEGLFSFPDSRINSAWGRGLKRMALEISTSMQAQASALAPFFDSYSMVQTVRRINVMQAETFQRTKPSVNMCKFPSAGKSLSRLSFSSKANAQIFAKYMQDYDLQHVNSAGGLQAYASEQEYVQKFKDNYCSQNQNGQDGLARFCNNTNGDRVNNDINFPYFFATREGNNIDFTDKADFALGTPDQQVLTDGERDLFYLTHNLFNSNTGKISETVIKDQDGQRLVTDLRSLQAIRNVAKNSFAVLVGNKSGGSSEGNNVHLVRILQTLGAGNTADYYGTGNGVGVSYDGAMEALTKKMYQDPGFYANLYDSPENVQRQKAAIKAIQLMQGWDIVKALHRREMLLSMLIEVKLRREQRRVEAGQK